MYIYYFFTGIFTHFFPFAMRLPVLCFPFFMPFSFSCFFLSRDAVCFYGKDL